MNRLKIYKLFLLACIFVLSACNFTSNPSISAEIKKSSAKLILDERKSPQEKIFMIYDYNAESGSLEYRPVTINKPTDNQFKDVLNAFFKHNHFLENIDSSNLVKIVEKQEETILYLADIEGINSNQNSKFFKEALELTMERNFSEDRISVVLNNTYR